MNLDIYNQNVEDRSIPQLCLGLGFSAFTVSRDYGSMKAGFPLPEFPGQWISCRFSIQSSTLSDTAD